MKKTIVITGANRGIGLEITKIMLQKDLRVIAISRSIDNLLLIDNSNLITMSLDITKDLTALIELISVNNYKIDYLLNNAGQLLNKSFLESNDIEFKQIFEVNFFAPARLIRSLIPYMLSCHVVNIGSMGGYQGSVKFPGLSAYSASKAALMNLSELLAEEFKESQIVFNSLALGAVQTEMLESAFPGYESNMPAEKMAGFICDFILSASNFFSGKIIPVSTSTP